MVLRLIAFLFAAALCVFYFTAEWAQIRVPGEQLRAVTAYDFFFMGIALTDADYNINGGVAYVWIILPLLATALAALTIFSGLTSRLFVLLGSLGSMGAIGYVALLGLMSGGVVSQGAVITAGTAMGLLITGLASRALPSKQVVKGTHTPRH